MREMSAKITDVGGFKAPAFLLLPLLILALLLSGCRHISPISAAKFKTVAESLDYTVDEHAADGTSVSFSENTVNANKGNVQVVFFVMPAEAAAKDWYDSLKGDAENATSVKYSSVSVDMNDHSFLKFKSKDTYYVIERVGDTVLDAQCPKEDASELDALLEAVDY